VLPEDHPWRGFHPMMSRRKAQALQEAAGACGAVLIWLVANADPAHPGQFTACGHTVDRNGDSICSTL
jgi:hypothetical protein